MSLIKKMMPFLFFLTAQFSSYCATENASSSTPEKAKEPGLVAYYNFDEGEGNKIIDLSGNKNNGKIIGKPEWVKVTDDFEVQFFGHALEMNSAVNCGNNPILDAKENGLSLEIWFKTGPEKDFCPLIQKFTTNWKSISRGYSLNIERNNKIRLWLGFGKQGKAFDGECVLLPNSFYHAIATYDGRFVKIYLNGEMILSSPESRPIAANPAENFYIGKKGVKSDLLLDKLKVYNKPLSALEVKAAFDADKLQNRYTVKNAFLKESSPNLLLNTNFKSCSNPGIPDWWGTGLAAEIKDWSDKIYGIDEAMKSPLPNVKCLRLNAIKSGFWLSSTFPCLPGGKDYTFSIYMKADNTDVTAILIVDKTSEHFKLTKDWTRYEVSGFQKKSSMRNLGISVFGDGIVWVAAPQLEYGTKATPFEISDTDNKKRKEERLPLSSVVCPKTDSAPVIDGALDDACWKKISYLKDFTLLGGGSIQESDSNSTKAKVLYDNKKLYIAFQCNESEMDKLKANIKDRDGGVFNDDSLEIFISTNPEASGFYQFATNSLGTRYDAFSGNTAWDSDWKCAVKKDKTAWSAELEIPFAAFDGSNMEFPWRMNLCRSRYTGKLPEYSSWSPIDGRSFHTPERMGRLSGIKIPAKISTPDKKIEPPGLEILTEYDYYTRDESAVLLVKWTHDYPAEFELVVKEKENGRTIENLTKRFNMPGASSMRVKLPLAKLPKGEYELVAKASAEGQDVVSATDSFRKMSPASTEVRVSKPGRYLLLNGKPILPYGPTVSISQFKKDLKTLWQLDDIVSHGFNCIWGPLGRFSKIEDLNAQEASIRSFLDKCNEKGLKVIFYIDFSHNIDYPTRKKITSEIIKRFKDHPAIIVWNFVDEPSLWWSKKNKESSIFDLYKTVKAIDPYRPAFINWCFWKKSPYGGLKSSDIASVDRYPLRYRMLKFNPEIISGLARDINLGGKSAKKPVNFFLQMQGFWDMSREPTPDEIKWITYINFTYGTRIFLYFSYKPMSADLWESMKPLGKDLKSLFKIVSHPNAKLMLSGRRSGISYSSWDLNGRRILIFVNEKNKPVQASLDLGELLNSNPQNKDATPLAENIETIELENNILNLSLTPLQCGIYELKKKGK